MHRVGDILTLPQSAVVLREILLVAGLNLHLHSDDAAIPATYWGEPEAGLSGNNIHARSDTPLHSLLHEACHAICMPDARRARLHRDAGGEPLEECGVCLLQLVMAQLIPQVGWRALAADMDAWGYSFREGSTAAWLAQDAADARVWLEAQSQVWSQVPNAARAALAALPVKEAVRCA